MLMYNFLGKTVTFEVVAELRPEWRTSNSAFTPTSRRLLRQLQELDPDTIYTVTQQFEFSYTLVDGDVQLNITSVNDNVIDEDTTSFKVEDYYPSTTWFVLHIIWVALGLTYNFLNVFENIMEILPFKLPMLFGRDIMDAVIQILIRLSYATFLLEIIFKDSEWEAINWYINWVWVWVVPLVYFILQEVVKTMIDDNFEEDKMPESLMEFLSFSKNEAPAFLTFAFTYLYTALIMEAKTGWVINIADASAIGKFLYFFIKFNNIK